MPYTLDWQEDGVVYRFYGDVVGDDLYRSNQEVHEHPQFGQICYKIIDCMNVRNFDCTTADIRVIAQMDVDAALVNPDVCVVGVSSSDLLQGFFNMYEMMSSANSWPTEIFASWEKAKQWVDKMRVA